MSCDLRSLRRRLGRLSGLGIRSGGEALEACEAAVEIIVYKSLRLTVGPAAAVAGAGKVQVHELLRFVGPRDHGGDADRLWCLGRRERYSAGGCSIIVRRNRGPVGGRITDAAIDRCRTGSGDGKYDRIT